MTKTVIIAYLILTFTFSYGQNPQVKKVTKITSSFDYIDFIKEGVIYLSKNGKVLQDTLITEYSQEKSLTRQKNIPYPLDYVGLVLVSNELNIKHEREYWSDSSFIDIYTKSFTDSNVQVKIDKGDTIQINKSYFKNGKLKKCHNRDVRTSYRNFDQIIIYKKKTKNREIATVITTYCQNCIIDTIRIDNIQRTKVSKKMVYNHDKNEWYIKEKIKRKRGKRIEWETFYHDYHGKYFTERTTIKYNKYGLPISEIKYDTYLKHIDYKCTYEYEYY